MPPDRYTRLHPDAKLSDDEVATLVAALQAMDEGAARVTATGTEPG